MSNNIMLTRIDNRMIHGQVVGQWAGAVSANLLVVCDDGVANDALEQSVMRMAAEAMGYGSRFFSVQKTLDVIEKASPNQKILLLCKTPESCRRLLEGGLALGAVQIGNMHYSEGKKQISQKAFVSEKELEDLRYISTHCDELYIQDTPETAKEKFKG
ncbi:MAG: PTS N-acetylgalactosamine transporter subunit IIB [Erysipelotrichaceae bacterium]|jgi:PTS system galactosamine-specific IIB component|nr:PTS N-acetylgalactosamine transporter subunit IIB [Erysipelotrichaceae bacterium]